MDEISVVELKPQVVIGIRRKASYTEIAPMIKELCVFADSKKVQLAGAPVFVCHEKSAEEAQAADKSGNADVEVCFPVAGKIRGAKGIKCYELPGGKMAKIVHKGPYQGCGAAYQKLFAWLAQNGKKPSGPTREVYTNDPSTVKPEEITTEIYAPI